MTGTDGATCRSWANDGEQRFQCHRALLRAGARDTGQGGPSPYESQGETEKHRNPFSCIHSLLSTHLHRATPYLGPHGVLGTQQWVRGQLYALMVPPPAVMDVKEVKQGNRQDKYKP